MALLPWAVTPLMAEGGTVVRTVEAWLTWSEVGGHLLWQSPLAQSSVVAPVAFAFLGRWLTCLFSGRSLDPYLDDRHIGSSGIQDWG